MERPNEKQVKIYKFDTFKCFTEKENEAYKLYDNCKGKNKTDERKRLKTDLDCLISENKDIRSINDYWLYKKTNGKIDKTKNNLDFQISIFESDIV